MVVDGADSTKVGDVLAQTLSYAAGGPGSGWAARVVGFSFLAAVSAGIVCLKLQGNRQWVLYTVIVVIWPTLLVGIIRPGALFLRYLLIPLTFGLLAFGHLLATMAERGPAWRAIVLFVLASSIVGNGLNTARLVHLGRGDYLDAVRTMAAHDANPVITVSSDHDFRNGLTLEYYRRFVLPEKDLQYFGSAEYPATGTQWYIKHGFAQPADVPRYYFDRRGNRFALMQQFPTADLSGMTWYLYVRAPQTPPTRPRGNPLLPGKLPGRGFGSPRFQGRSVGGSPLVLPSGRNPR